MLFNSISFIIFLVVVFAIYWILPNKYKNLFLLLSSCYFYMKWNPIYILLILFVIAVSYSAGRLIETKKNKKTILVTSIVLITSVLFFFKYFNFMSRSVVSLFRVININLNTVALNVLLPVGISFFTFQAIGYCVDVYRKGKAEHDFITYAAFISYFPQLVAGPIERMSNLLPQIKNDKKFNYEKASYGLMLMVWGYFKKVAIADNFAIYVEKVFSNVNSYSGFAIVIAALLFTVQIYCDFSGYSDIAVGTSKLFGIDLMDNFRSPYFSKSIKEFWSRWHISLSTWFKDYVYIPLGGNRKGKLRTSFNTMVVFLLSGLWHGANWTYVFWGAIHGLAQVIENLLPKKNNTYWFKSLFKMLFVFVFCAFAWIFFRANSINDAFVLIGHMFVGIGNIKNYLILGLRNLEIGGGTIAQIGLCLILLGAYDYCSIKVDVIKKISSINIVLRWLIICIIILIILLLLPPNMKARFIYFQF